MKSFREISYIGFYNNCSRKGLNNIYFVFFYLFVSLVFHGVVVKVARQYYDGSIPYSAIDKHKTIRSLLANLFGHSRG